jgi:hypothetical protein
MNMNQYKLSEVDCTGLDGKWVYSTVKGWIKVTSIVNGIVRGEIHNGSRVAVLSCSTYTIDIDNNNNTKPAQREIDWKKAIKHGAHGVMVEVSDSEEFPVEGTSKENLCGYSLSSTAYPILTSEDRYKYARLVNQADAKPEWYKDEN